QGAEGLILSRHGIFTWGDSARDAYERMIALVSRAETALARNATSVFVAASLPQRRARAAAVAPILRGLAAIPAAPADGAWQRFVLDFRTSPAIRDYVSGAAVARYACQGTVTPDHVIRIKPKPLIVPPPAADDLAGFAAAAKAA